MGTASVLLLIFVVCSTSFSSSVVSANELSLVVAESIKLQLSPSLPVEKSPSSKAGSVMLCSRVEIHGLPRLKNLRKFAHSLKVNVSHIKPSARIPNVDVCFHRNLSLGIGMCPKSQWEKLVEGSWIRSMSPFDHKVLDICMASSSLETLQVSIVEEFFVYRIIFLFSGILLMSLASSLSKSLVFYYSSAMAVGIILVILMVLFQGMKLLPTGRKYSIGIFVYSSIVGLGSFFLSYLPRLLRTILTQMGISEDMYNPLAIFLLVFLVLAGAWLGFWVVRKLVLTEDGLVDVGVSNFVAWSIRIIAIVMILQSSVDPLLAAGALLCGIFVSSLFRRIIRSKFLRHLYKNLLRTDKSNRRHRIPGSSPLKESYDEHTPNIQDHDNSEFLKSQSRPFTLAPCSASVRGSTRTPRSRLSGSETYYSSFHSTPERRKFSKDEWEKFTKDSTKKALEELVSSPDFSKWAVTRADRITLSPNTDNGDRPRWWLTWL